MKGKVTQPSCPSVMGPVPRRLGYDNVRAAENPAPPTVPGLVPVVTEFREEPSERNYGGGQVDYLQLDVVEVS